MTSRKPASLRTAIMACGLVAASVAVASAPPDQYEISAGGVQDRRTGLFWQRAPDGMARTQAAAVAYCVALNPTTTSTPAWRLPTIAELATLVDVRSPAPMIDSVAFPNTKSTPYWSSTPSATQSAFTWALNFATGVANGYSTTGSPEDVRCVQSTGVQ